MCDCVDCKNEECKCEDVKVETTVEGNAAAAVQVDTQPEMQSAKETKPEEKAKGKRGRKPKAKEEKKCCAPCDPPCDGVAVSKGLCSAHYMRQRNGMPIDVPIVRKKLLEEGERKKKPGKICCFPCDPPCSKKAVAHGLCYAHYARMRRGSQKDGPVRSLHAVTEEKQELAPVSEQVHSTPVPLPEQIEVKSQEVVPVEVVPAEVVPAESVPAESVPAETNIQPSEQTSTN